MNEFEKIQELLLEKERNQQKWNLEQDHKNKDLRRVYRMFILSPKLQKEVNHFNLISKAINKLSRRLARVEQEVEKKLGGKNEVLNQVSFFIFV